MMVMSGKPGQTCRKHDSWPENTSDNRLDNPACFAYNEHMFYYCA